MVVGSNPTRLARLWSSCNADSGLAKRTSHAAHYRPTMLRLHVRRRAVPRHHEADRIFIATLVIGFLAIALLLLTIYPPPMHLLGVY